MRESSVVYGEGWTVSEDGVELFWRRWLPEGGAPPAALLFVHGLGEHSGRYREIAAWFAGRGYACWASDCRGHGRSQGRRVHVRGFDEYLADASAAAALARAATPGCPLFLVGHSQGGLVALRYALAHPEAIAGVIVSSPFLGVHPQAAPGALLETLARILSAVAPGVLVPSGVDPDLLSHDPAVCRSYREDPLVSRRVSARWFTAVTAAQEATRGAAPGLRVPALVMQSGSDRLVDPAATREWAAAAPAELVDFVEWEGFYHEMFNEPGRERVFARMVAWLRRWTGR